MAGVKPIRITKNDREEYRRLANNAKAKINRTNKKYGVDLSGEIELKGIDSFKTRKEYNEWKAKAKSLTNRSNTKFQFVKNDYGVVASVQEIKQIKRNTKAAQRIADKMIKKAEKLPFISGGKEQGTVGQRMMQMKRPNAAGITRPSDFDFDKIRSRDYLETKKESADKRKSMDYYDKRMENMRNNFLDLLKLSLNSDADVLIEKLKLMPVDDFYEMYLMFDEFDFDMYDSEGIETMNEGEAERHVSKMLNNVDRYFEGKLNFDMRGF